MKLILSVGIVFLTQMSWADIRMLEVSSQSSVVGLRPQYTLSYSPLSPKSNAAELAQLKIYQTKQENQKCQLLGKTLEKKYKGLLQWILLSELDCSFATANGKASEKLTEKLTEKQVSAYLAKLDVKWIQSGPYKEKMARAYFKLRFLQMEALSVNSREKAWSAIEQVLDLKDWMNEDELSSAYIKAAELAFIRQNLSLAENMYTRALEVKDSGEVKKKLDSLRDLILKKESSKDKQILKPERLVREELESSTEENEIYQRLQQAYKTSEIVVAAEDTIKLMKTFPGSKKSKWASEKLMDNFIFIASKNDKNLEPMKDKLLSLVSKVPASFAEGWVKSLFQKSLYNETYRLSKKIFLDLDEDSRIAKALLLGGISASYVGEDKDARRFFLRLVREFSGSPEAVSALFRVGLLEYRLQNYSGAAGYFEKLLVIPNANDFELRGRYWLWRTLQLIDPLRAKEQRDILAERFPLTYYGLLAAQDQNGKGFVVPLFPTENFKAKFTLTGQEQLVWQRVQLLLEAGWMQEARAELATLNVPKGEKERLIFAKLLAANFQYPKAIQMISEVWDQNKTWMQMPFYLSSYPKEFPDWVKEQAQKNNLHPLIVYSLIRQESAFFIEAVSKSNAQGLMQIIPPTTKEIAQELKEKEPVLPDDMFQPQKNITYGSYYLAKMRDLFGGYIPLALAAYNAGPNRLQLWLETRLSAQKSLANAEGISKFVSNEVWMDELPWDETSFYVKAILRNFIIYNVLDSKTSSPVALANPVWKTIPVAE